jgi:ferredoxin
MSHDTPPTTRIRVLPHAELCPQGLEFDARRGRKLVDELLVHGIAIEHACDKVGACATCHVHVRKAPSSWHRPTMTKKTSSTTPGAWTRSLACHAA